MKAPPLNSPPQSGRGLGGEAFQIAFYLIHFKPLLYELPHPIYHVSQKGRK